MKVIIIGGVAGGATAAARMRRMSEDAHIVLLERGEHISYANCGLPYYVGEVIKRKSNILLNTPESFKSRYNIDVRINSEAVEIYRENKKVKVRNSKTGEYYNESYDRLLIATGADPLIPSIKGLEEERTFSLRNVRDAVRMRAFIKKEKPGRAIIIGGSYIGLEIAENLKESGIDVSVVEMASQLLPSFDYEISAQIQSHLHSRGVEFYLNNIIKEVQYKNGSLIARIGDKKELQADMIVVAAGMAANSHIAVSSGLKVGSSGGIKIDKFCRTSDENIYAVGDAVQICSPGYSKAQIVPLAGPANKQARIAADNIVLGNETEYGGSVGTSIVKIFDLSAASTGFSENYLTKNRIKYNTSIIHTSSHAGYYPGAKTMTIKLNFSPLDGSILGAQAVGREGVDKAIEVFSVACQFKLGVKDMKDMDQAYAPPYSSAKSPVNMICCNAENILNKKLKTVSWREVEERKGGVILLDVSSPAEFKRNKIPGAINIPVNSLRQELRQLDKKSKIYVYCALGLRGYIACRILYQKGFKEVYNIAGGYRTWRFATKKY
ncbi:MAG: FAD-dependent oxidoreductase [Elusimicrobiota bacterium]